MDQHAPFELDDSFTRQLAREQLGEELNRARTEGGGGDYEKRLIENATKELRAEFERKEMEKERVIEEQRERNGALEAEVRRLETTLKELRDRS